VALRQLTRPGVALERWTAPQRQRLHDALSRLALPLADDPVQPRALLAFARAAADAALALAPRRAPRFADGDSVRALARAALAAEAGVATSEDDLVRRAVTRAWRERRRGKPGTVALDVAERDPLRALLHVPATGKLRVARNDARAKIANAAARGVFGDVLHKAARFAPEVLEPALGEGRWASPTRARPRC
jgi:hypothetical protein